MMNPDAIAAVIGAVTGVTFLAGSFVLRIGTMSAPEPGLFPCIGGTALLVLSTILFARSVSVPQSARAEGRAPGGERSVTDVRVPGAIVGALVVQAALLERAGYILSTSLVAVITMRALGVTSWRTIGIASVAIAVATYGLFAQLLGVDLPAGLLTLGR
jgi:putative tricarboxylic transport membrane protein